LGDLIGLGKIRIIIVFTVKFNKAVDLAVKRKADPYAVSEDLFVQDRKRPWESEADWACLTIRVLSELR